MEEGRHGGLVCLELCFTQKVLTFQEISSHRQTGIVDEHIKQLWGVNVVTMWHVCKQDLEATILMTLVMGIIWVLCLYPHQIPKVLLCESSSCLHLPWSKVKSQSQKGGVVSCAGGLLWRCSGEDMKEWGRQSRIGLGKDTHPAKV